MHGQKLPTLLRDCLHRLLNSPTPFDRCQTVNHSPPLLLSLPLPPSPARYFLAGECENTHAFPKLQPSGFDHAQHGPRDPAASAGAARSTPLTSTPLTATLGACWRPPVVMYPLSLVQAGTTTSGKSVAGDCDAFRVARPALDVFVDQVTHNVLVGRYA